MSKYNDDMKSIKIAQSVHSKLITITHATGDTISDVIDDLLDSVYPEVNEVDSEIHNKLQQLNGIIQSRRRTREQ